MKVAEFESLSVGFRFGTGYELFCRSKSRCNFNRLVRLSPQLAARLLAGMTSRPKGA
jgi:hypothetical protein